MHLKRPRGRHKTFRIHHNHQTVKHEELDAVNVMFLARKVSEERAVELLRLLMGKLRPKQTLSFLPENEALAQAFYDARIAVKKGNVAPMEARRRVFWAVSKLGSTPLLTSTPDELYKALSHLDPGQKKRAATTINSILRWRGLEKYVSTERVTREEPAYLTLEEVLSFSLPRREWQLCVLTAFATGCRYGELFALTPTSLREEGSHVYIARQVKVGGAVTETKNRKTGSAFIVPELQWAVKEWVAIAQDVRLAMRGKRQPGEAFQLAAFKALKREITFHNLRHSYARCMLSGNEGQWPEHADLEDLRSWMRDRMSTIETYYQSWVETSSKMRSNVKRFHKQEGAGGK